jgi:predicted enzyme related to lactoylglutathione lyase
MAGQIVHVEFASEDADRAARFWNGVFGWSFGESAMPEMDYRMTQIAEGQGAAIFPSDERPGHGVYYHDTDDIQATIAKVRELGGEAGERQAVPSMGWFAACKDSEGNSFSLWQTDSSAG